MAESHVQPADWRRPLWGCLQLTVMALGFASVLLNAVLLTRYMLPGLQLTSEGESLTEFASAVQHKGVNLPSIPEDKGDSKSIDPQRMHGPLGLNPDGTPAHVPAPPPPPDIYMPMELARGGGFNLQLSDHLPLDREAPDSRHAACKALEYNLQDLPAASVLMVFYNEPFSTLMRSVHSVLNKTPPALLHEVVLLDDGSDHVDVAASGNGKLQRYVDLLPKVRLLRSPRREGIVGARLRAIRAAEAPIFVVLDSHIEVQDQWLEPLVSRIQQDPRRIVMPQVDGIDAETFEHIAGGIGCKLGFLWQLMEHSYEPHQMQRLPREQQRHSPTDFQTSPAMAGGLFAANKDFFFSIGAYDEGFKYWGTENLEFSFRLWQCGGILECAPCSRVYHIFRKGGAGYSFPSRALTVNKMRTLLWMDEYADLAWRVLGRPNVDYGAESLKKRQEWRREHNCKSFKWYMENVFPEADVVHLSDVPFLGQLENKASGLCMDSAGRASPGGHPVLAQCAEGHATQEFMYFRWDYEDGMLRNRFMKECLSVKGGQLAMASCDPDDAFQKWTWQEYHPPDSFTFPTPASTEN
ncbi:UDP-N-acetyl-D-galactosamine:polypeptide N-acetylgalactosaminyltransferase T3, putative [Eimeria praecox]|uniref:UDP-N-acetyl-D-galactosamine:polypeptide N-acetylgalactosaminyltransferase T3, putative n=1 Tax=Eimeria praecox TaxID=51316 RepID=U6H363_9EIME|nr:UDP-N-acetyl-D-galactosamine:polypeptide N-acetylgalactosaminyltransferase T3, putative [Eimeria praecox]